EQAVSDELLAGKLVESGRLNRWQAEQLRAGRTKFNLGPYHLIDSIGKGGMGHVYKAEHTIMGRVVAVKVLPRTRATPDAIVTFSREIRAQAQLDHENLVRAYDAGRDGNVDFLVTEYVPGTDLRRLIRGQGPLGMQLAASIISQAARGLEHAHERGLIHRDVKPGNLLVTPEGRTKVSDLGLAGYFKEVEPDEIYGGKVVGTADYLAPEQITTPDKLSPVCDIYALGCTLYYAVTGKVPFPGGTAREKARAHCNVAPLDPRRLNAELSDDFVEVIAEMMAKRASERMQSAGEVVQRLAPWVSSFLPKTAEDLPPMIPVPPPIIMPPSLLNVPSRVADTEPFLVQPAEEHSNSESASQISLGTQPVAGGSEETMPVMQPYEISGVSQPPASTSTNLVVVYWEQLSPRARWWLTIAAASAGGAIAALVLRSLF
ncbi:MAG TPA: serine/threonine-protein kinase, partial [Pirellulales bacterium]|nr:serine/threonine-protein kinase [Pirellulales bacterium]